MSRREYNAAVAPVFYILIAGMPARIGSMSRIQISRQSSGKHWLKAI
jgi:hypothetical protein